MQSYVLITQHVPQFMIQMTEQIFTRLATRHFGWILRNFQPWIQFDVNLKTSTSDIMQRLTQRKRYVQSELLFNNDCASHPNYGKKRLMTRHQSRLDTSETGSLCVCVYTDSRTHP